MHPEPLFRRYQELQAYVGWSEEDARRVAAVGPLLAPFFPPLIDDFYEEIARHPNAAKVITGGQAQIERLKGTLIRWIEELFSGKYDMAYVHRRWRVGLRHVEIGLDQVYTNVALSRLRSGMMRLLVEVFPGPADERAATLQSLNRLIDLDLAIIEDAYQTEHQRRSQRSERLATIGQVAGGVAHELRNPLNVVKTSVYYLLHARNPSPEKSTEHLKRIEKHVGVADGVITALSNFAKMPVPDLHPFSVRECVAEALDLNPVPENVAVAVEIPPDLPKGLADEAQVRIVVGNLIRNAREAMPEGGRLTVAGSAADGKIRIAVSDTGTGIAPDHLARILEPLYSTKARGLGLGLAIARAILDKNNGTLKVESELGKGSTFTVELLAASE